MPIREASFWVGLTVFGTGLFFLVEFPVLAWALIVAGLFAVAYAVYAHYHPAAVRPQLWAILLVLTWGAIAYDLYDRHQSDRQQTVLPIVKAFGTSLPDQCLEALNGSLLVAWSSKYDVGFVCGLEDSSLDKFQDTRITFSPAFSIHPGDIVISVNYSNEMKEKQQELVNAMVARIPKGTPNGFVVLSTHVWYEPVLYPRQLNRSDIHRLSDVSRYGGVLVSEGLPKP